MKQFPIIFGTKNSSQKLLNAIDENVIEDDNDESNLIEILDYIVSFLNATLLPLINRLLPSFTGFFSGLN